MESSVWFKSYTAVDLIVLTLIFIQRSEMHRTLMTISSKDLSLLDNLLHNSSF